MVVNHYTEKLFPYIYYAPKEMQQKYWNGYELFSEQWVNENSGDSIFCGILFRDNKVYTINIEILCKDKNYEPEYLEITDTFNKLLKKYNIYNLCILISAILRKKYYRECSLAKNIRQYIIYDKPYRLPKFRYQITKHHSRHRKFYFDSSDRGKRVWDKILYSALNEVCNLDSFVKRPREKRPSLFSDYNSTPKFRSSKDLMEYATGLQNRRERKLRRGAICFTIKSR